MKITYLLVALLLVPCFTAQATARVRTSESDNQVHVGTRPTMGNRLATDGGPLHSLNQPSAPQDDWPADMILDSFETSAGSNAPAMLLHLI